MRSIWRRRVCARSSRNSAAIFPIPHGWWLLDECGCVWDKYGEGDRHTSPEEYIHAHYDETGGEKADEDAEFVGEGGHGGVGGDVVRVVVVISIGACGGRRVYGGGGCGCGCGVGHFDF